MITKTHVTQIVALAVVVAAAIAWTMGGDGYGQGKNNEPKNQKVDAGRTYFESSSCYDCHQRQPQPYRDPVVMPIICNCDEYEKWETQDKHRLAFMALKGKLAQTIGTNLKITDVKTDKACVSCHGIWIDDAKQRQENQTLIEEGVSCVVCHSTEKVDWVDKHGSTIKKTRLQWRDLTRSEKEKQYGMVDLWDPAKRTQLCVSCHIGNAREGKVLTHEMYAAGHPPLPSFDMANFSDAMRHWQYMSEKTDEVKTTFKIKSIDIDLEQINLVNVGSLISFRETMILLGQQASKSETWPELAQFDCYSCHHDLKTPSWRQKRGYTGKPGRPLMPAWSTSLVELALFHSAGADERADDDIKSFRAKLAKLQHAFDVQPFGNKEKIAEATKGLVEFIDLKSKILQTLPGGDKTTHKRLLTQLIDKQNRTLLDHESARQVAGAFRAIYADGWKTKADAEVMKQLALLDDDLSLTFKSAARKKYDDARFAISREFPEQRKKGSLSKFLELKLGALQSNYANESNSYLEKINQHDPEAFQHKMKRIADIMNKR